MGLLLCNRAEKTRFRARGFMEPLRTSIPIIEFSGNWQPNPERMSKGSVILR